MMDNWIDTAIQFLVRSLKPIPHELNEIDWKSGLSDKSERLAQHISAFANYPNGGFLAYGIANDGSPKPLSKAEMDEIISETIDAGLIKSSDSENSSKKFASYVPYWA